MMFVYVTFQAITMGSRSMSVWDVAICSVAKNGRFGGAYGLHYRFLKRRSVSSRRTQSSIRE
jgi:hypothetical protein